MSLVAYRRKRNFRRTPEPAGRAKKGKGRRFVVQKHAATRLHYDFRLELDGVLKSWAVPKGPSLDPDVKALAVQVEDHPLEYRNFEGIIPAGEYGGGTVMVWDQGTWEPEGDAAAALARGKLNFKLHGEKLTGEWTLVRMHERRSADGKNWLLMKHADAAAQPTDEFDVREERPKSVVSGRELEEIAASADRVWHSNGQGAPKKSRARSKGRKSTQGRHAKNSRKIRRDEAAVLSTADLAALPGARRTRQPLSLQPQKATLVSTAPSGDQWLHEVKFDGYRILAFVRDGKVRLMTRNDKNWTSRFAKIAAAVEALPIANGVLDGEVVSLAPTGLSDFQALQNQLKQGDAASLVYFVFDAPFLESVDLRQVSLVERKAALVRLLAQTPLDQVPTIRYSDHIRGEGESVIQHACQLSLEGVISKLAASPYEERRTDTWVKTKCLQRQEFVIGGYTAPSGSRSSFGALLLGYYQDEKLIYSGRVGTGFTEHSLKQLARALKRRRTDEMPFDDPPATSERRGVSWVRPELVGEIEFTEWTQDGRLRHPSFQGLRDDKSPRDIGRERPRRVRSAAPSNPGAHRRLSDRESRPGRSAVKKSAATSPRKTKRNTDVQVAGVRLSNPDRVLFPDVDLTKRDLAEFYERIADWVLPHVVGRPLTLVRCPRGQGAVCFYQKHLTEAIPDAVRGVVIQEKTKRAEYVVIDDLAGLVSLVQLGVLELHPWPALADNVERPDRLIFDLDPGPGVAWKEVVTAARDLHQSLDALGLTTFVRLSGGKGLHIVAPLAPQNTWDELKSFAKAIAEGMAELAPNRYTAVMSKAKRQEKIFLDYLRNQRGATAVASYSTRARAGAPVATPITWKELTPQLLPNKFTVANLPARLKRLAKRDPWKGFFDIRQTLPLDFLRPTSGK